MPQSAEVKVLPFWEVPPFAEPLVRAIGVAAVNWGKVEVLLDMLVRAVNKREYSKRKFRKTPDISFRLRREIFQDWYAEDPRFAEVHDWAAAVCIGLRKGNCSRNLIFHSSVQHFLDGEPPTIEVVNMQGKDDAVNVSRGSWTERDILRFNTLACHICEDLARIAEVTMTEAFRERLRTT